MRGIGHAGTWEAGFRQLPILACHALAKYILHNSGKDRRKQPGCAIPILFILSSLVTRLAAKIDIVFWYDGMIYVYDYV